MGILGKVKKKNRHRAVVVGLDGVPYSMLENLRKNGKVPNMDKIFNSGSFNPMNVSIPEISSISWSSFMTGAQSGEHGIYGFIDLEPGTYNLKFPNYNDLKAPAIWDELSRIKKKTVVINMPATYPARKINGALISGFVAIDINKAVYPPNLISKLQKMDYRIDLDLMKARQDSEYLFQDLKETLKGRERAVDQLWEEIDWDLLVVVVTGTDRLMHFMWDAYEDENHDHNQAFIEYYENVDAFIGRVYDRFLGLEGSQQGENHFYMLSDHGFTKIKTEVYLNRWLQDNGYLKFKKERPDTIMDIGAGSTAFVMDPSRIHINLKEKYPLGTVDKNDYERICRELKDGFESLTIDGGNQILKNVYFKEELYQGPYLDRAPDLVLLSHHGYDLKGKAYNNRVFARTDLEGMHTQDDAFFYSSDGTKCNSIFNAKELIIKHFTR